MSGPRTPSPRAGRSVPRVSVLLAVHNGAAVLEGALASLAAQCLEDWECIAVDDGSTDGSGEVLRRWASLDTRFSVLANPRNLGLPASLNRALDQARGDYLARMDADDLCLPERLREQAVFLDTHPEITVLGGAALYMDAAGAPLGLVRMPERHDAIMAALPRLNPLIHPTVMMRRKALLEAGGYDPRQRYAQDLELWARGASLGWRFHNLSRPVLRFRSQPRSHSTHAWAVFRLRIRNGLRYGYPLRGVFWASVGVLQAARLRLGQWSLAQGAGEPGIGGRGR